MKTILHFQLLLGILASSNGFIFPILFPISIKLTFHQHKVTHPQEPVYHFQTIPVYKEVVKKDPGHDKEKHSYGDGYKGSSYGDGYQKTFSDEHHVKGHNYGSTYGTAVIKESGYHAPVDYKNNGYVNIGTTFSGDKGAGSINIKATGYVSDLPTVQGTSYSGDVKGASYSTSYSGDLGNAKTTDYGTSYNTGSDKGTAYGTSYSDVAHIKGSTHTTTYGDASNGIAVVPYNPDGTKTAGYSTSYVDDSSHKGQGYAVAYDEPSSSKGVVYTTSYSDQSAAKGVPYKDSVLSIKPVGYSDNYPSDKVKEYGNTYESANAYAGHQYSPTYSDEGAYVVHHPQSGYGYEERKDDLQLYAGFGTTIYGDSYAKVVYVPKTQIKVSVRAHSH